MKKELLYLLIHKHKRTQYDFNFQFSPHFTRKFGKCEGKGCMTI